ncbi:MAG: flagellar assembly peptidoglycan hydrolase FlgJ [Steroidobacteraceae bacterium]
MTIGAVDSSFFADPASLAGVKREAAQQSPEALREVARQFESLFTTMMLKSMRQATPTDSLFGSEQQDFYQDLFDQQMATQLSKGKGLGLSDMLVRQLMQSGGEAAGVDGAAGAASGEQSAAHPATAAATQGVDWTPGNRDEFVRALMPAAREAGQRLGVDPMNIIAHAALETGWGRSLPTDAQGRSSFNLFGIKAGAGWSGASVASTTREFAAGSMNEVTGRFRAYGSPAQSVDDYARLIGGNSRYSAALGTGSDTQAFASALQKGGYATDPDYVDKLTRIAADLKAQLNRPITAGEA